MTADLSAPYFASSPDAALTLLTRRFWDTESQAESRADALRSAASSAGMEAIQARFVETRRAARRGGDRLYNAAAATKESTRAYAAFHRGTPTPDEIDAARADLADTVEAVRQAALAEQPTAALCEIRDAAQRHLDDLRYRRRQAISELERALNRVLERLRSRPGRAPDYEGDGGFAIPGTPAPPGRPSHPIGPPTPGLPPRAAPPATPPQTSISNTAPSTDTIAALLSAAAKPQPAQPQMPMQQQPAPPMMQMPQVPQQSPPAAAPASRDRRRDGALDLDDLLSEEDRDAPGLAAAAVAAPRPAPAGSIAPTTPSVPAVSGYSADGLTTQSPTGGRPGAAPAGAFAPPTSLSGSHIASQQLAGSTPGTGTAPAAHPGGAPMGTPMAGMPGAGAGGGSGSGRPPVLKHDDGSQLDHGPSAQGAAVRGGTIAQRRDEDQRRG